jgi:hypothetical protein
VGLDSTGFLTFFHGRRLILKNEVNNMELKSGLGFVVRAEKECDVYCPICHKVLHVKAGDVIPRCCGKPMKVMD